MASRLVKWTLRHVRSAAPQEDNSKQNHRCSLTDLPNEILLDVLEAMDDASLHRMVAVSKQFFLLGTTSLRSRYDLGPSSGSVTVKSSNALRALRVACLAFSKDSFRTLNYAVHSNKPNTKDVRRIHALLRRYSTHPRRLQWVSLDFGSNLIRRPVGWTIGGLAPALLMACCGGSTTALFLVNNGLFTCKTKTLGWWSPYTRGQYSRMQLHDGSRQPVPSIQSIETLDVTYPVCTSISPLQPWTMVVVNMRAITTLFLSIRLSSPEWHAILSAISLPNLGTVGIWAENITLEAAANFLQRHASTLTTLTYMSPRAVPLSPSPSLPTIAAPLVFPQLKQLTALANYVVNLFNGATFSEKFPALITVELWPPADAGDPENALSDALRLLSTHPPLTHLTLWLMDHGRSLNRPPSAWPVFPAVDALVLNLNGTLRAESLAMLLAHAFPVLRRLDLNISILQPKNALDATEVRRVKRRAMVRVIADMNPAIERFYVDREFVEA